MAEEETKSTQKSPGHRLRVRHNPVHHLLIRQKAEEPGAKRYMHGAVTEVLLDGKPLRGVSKLLFEVAAKQVAKVHLEVYADVEIEGMAEAHLTPADESGSHELGRLEPRPAHIQRLQAALNASAGGEEADDGEEA